MKMKKLLPLLIILTLFETVAVTLWLTKSNIFYLFNFSYIGLSISLGIYLYMRNYRHARRVVQLLVGSYMLVYLGLICGENMQIEGFWYYLFTGVFEAATIHYAVAKIFGPLVFGARMVRVCLLDRYGARFSAVQDAGKTAQEDRVDTVYHICRVTDIRFRSLSREGREYRADNVHRVHHREYRLLRSRDRARLCVS